MGLERRGNNYYFYEKERDGGKVRSRYVGMGETAHLINQLNLLKKDEAEFERRRKSREKQREMQTEAELDVAVEAVREIGELLTDAFFLTNGFHQHKRQWRRKRAD
jgi:hypothetical protein